MSMFFIEKLVSQLYRRFGDEMLTGKGLEELRAVFDKYKSAQDYISCAKIMLCISYELQELKGKDAELEALKSLLDFDVESIKDEHICAYGMINLSLGLATQTKIPASLDAFKLLMDEAYDKYQAALGVANAFKEAYEYFSKVSEDMFDANVIMQSVYDYETDVLYYRLLDFMSPINGAVKTSTDHPMSMMDWEPEAVDSLAQSWTAIYGTHFVQEPAPVHIGEILEEFRNPKPEDIEAWEQATGQKYLVEAES